MVLQDNLTAPRQKENVLHLQQKRLARLKTLEGMTDLVTAKWTQIITKKVNKKSIFQKRQVSNHGS